MSAVEVMFTSARYNWIQLYLTTASQVKEIMIDLRARNFVYVITSFRARSSPCMQFVKL